MTDRVTAKCPRCNPDGIRLDRDVAERAVEAHNEEDHDGEPVAAIAEGDR